MESYYSLPHVIEAQQFPREWLEEVLFPLTDDIAQSDSSRWNRRLADKEMVLLFAEESLRTRARFEIAMRRLGGQVIFGSVAAQNFSSVATGKSLEDTIHLFNEYETSVIVLRHNEEGGAARAAMISDIPIINAGDGFGQHPTQALIDLYAIRRNFKTIDGLSVAMIGNLTNNRVINSLAYLIGKYRDITIYFVSPESKRIGSNIAEYLKRHSVDYFEVRDICEIASQVDVFYQTRTQTNLEPQPRDRKDWHTVIDRTVLDFAKKDSIILHPFPCLDEIARSEVDCDPRAIYLRTNKDRMSQVKGGLYITMALLVLILSGK